MALFQTVQEVFKTMGIHPSLSQPDRFCWLNVKIYICLIIILQTLTASTAFFLFKANTIQSLADSFYVSLSHVAGLIYILITVWKVTDILLLIDQYEKFIQKRKLRHLQLGLQNASILIKILYFVRLNRINGFNSKCRNVR